MIRSKKKARKEGAIFKIDMKKAYDQVDWGFVNYMLGRFGFEGNGRHGFGSVFPLPLFSVLMNGSPSHLFKASGGLRQGGPLPPFLFTIVKEGLSDIFCEG